MLAEVRWGGGYFVDFVDYLRVLRGFPCWQTEVGFTSALCAVCCVLSPKDCCLHSVQNRGNVRECIFRDLCFSFDDSQDCFSLVEQSVWWSSRSLFCASGWRFRFGRGSVDNGLAKIVTDNSCRANGRAWMTLEENMI